MTALKDSFERLGLEDVRTRINSGNVLFRSSATDARALERRIDRMLAGEHAGQQGRREGAEMARVVKIIAPGEAGSEWK